MSSLVSRIKVNLPHLFCNWVANNATTPSRRKRAFDSANMTTYLGDSEYTPRAPYENFSLASHFDRHAGQCYEKVNGRGSYNQGTDPATGRPLLYNTSHAYDAQRAERVDMLLPLRSSSELTFQGYFVDEFATSEQAVRRCNITFFCEDNTLRIYEPKTPNSGYTQGEFLKRCFVLNPASGRPFAVDDFVIGQEIDICGHKIVISDADALTRKQLNLGDASPVPSGKSLWPYNSPVSVFSSAGTGTPNFSRRSQLQPQERVQPSKMKMFLEHDREVLRFHGVWHSGADHRGDRNVVVHIFIVDNSIEIVEGDSREQDLTKQILRRTQVVKSGQRYNCISQSSDVKYFEPKDFVCGQQVVLFGKRISLQHTDEFTQAWYKQCYPELHQSLPRAYDAPAQQNPAPAAHFNGYGNSINEQFTQVDDDDGTDDGVVLRFQATLYDPEQKSSRLHQIAPTTLYDMADAERRFVVSFYPGDSSCMVSELPSAVTKGGTFLKRGRYRFHETGRRSSSATKPALLARRFRSTDFAQGAIVSFESEPLSGSRSSTLNIPAGPTSARLLIGSADTYAAEYMQREATRRSHRIQATLDCLRQHFLHRNMSPAWVRGQMAYLGRPRVSKSEMRRALDCLELTPLVFSNGALDFLFSEFGEIDQTYGPMVFFDDIIDELVRPVVQPLTKPTVAKSTQDVLAALEVVPFLRSRLRDCDVEGSGIVGIADVQVVLRQQGVVSTQGAIAAALRDFMVKDGSSSIQITTMCDQCTASTWAAPLQNSSPKDQTGSASTTDSNSESFLGQVPDASIAAIAGLGRFRTSAQAAPEHHFYQNPSLKTEDPVMAAMRNRMLGSGGVAAVMSTPQRRPVNR